MASLSPQDTMPPAQMEIDEIIIDHTTERFKQQLRLRSAHNRTKAKDVARNALSFKEKLQHAHFPPDLWNYFVRRNIWSVRELAWHMNLTPDITFPELSPDLRKRVAEWAMQQAAGSESSDPVKTSAQFLCDSISDDLQKLTLNVAHKQPESTDSAAARPFSFYGSPPQMSPAGSSMTREEEAMAHRARGRNSISGMMGQIGEMNAHMQASSQQASRAVEEASRAAQQAGVAAAQVGRAAAQAGRAAERASQTADNISDRMSAMMSTLADKYAQYAPPQ